MLTSRGFDAVVNDSLIAGVLQFATLVGGILCGFSAALIAGLVFNTDYVIWAAIGFVVGFVCMIVVTEVIESSVISLFICLAEDPAALLQTKPQTYHKLTQPLWAHYPETRFGVGQV